MIRISRGQKTFNAFNIIILTLLMLTTLDPFYYVICASFSASSFIEGNHGFLWKPIMANLGAYRKTFNHPLIMSGFLNIFKIMIVALPLNLIVTIIAGYFMSARGMMFKKPIVFFMLFTMYFSGGLIPSYLNIKEIGLFNSLWALIIPGCLSVYNAIITKTAMEAIPESLSESAYIDGASDLRVLCVIIVPLVIPTLAVMLLYYGVGHWNSWFSATIYLQDNTKLPIQAILRSVVIANEKVLGAATEVVTTRAYANDYAESIKYAVIVISTIPILCVYPFLQKFFIKGVMIGAVKG